MKKSGCLLLVILIFAADQLSKYWVEMSLIPYEPWRITSFFNITLAYNSGAAFSFLNGAGNWHRWFLPGLSILMSAFFSWWLWRTPRTHTLQLLALSLLLGGALGNLVDRALWGEVIDFIELYYKNYHWPIFNIADTSICIGAVLLGWDLLRNPHQDAGE